MDADFYFKVDDDVAVNVDALAAWLQVWLGVDDLDDSKFVQGFHLR